MKQAESVRRWGVWLLAAGLLAASSACSRSGVDRVAEGSGGSARKTPSASAKAPAPSAKPTPLQVPDGDAFFDPPNPLPGDKPGDVVWQRPATGTQTLAGGAKELLVMYRTTGVDGAPVPASGTVTLPNGPAPQGGWPVIAWDHGTTGIGPQCAPSRGPGPYAQGAGDMLAAFVQRGYAVVQPDYVGMGVTGLRHPYLNGKSAAYATLDLVRAARTLDPGVGTTWFVAGHSQGGHAALWSANYEPEYAPELDLKGVVAIAPGNGFDQMPALVARRDSLAEPYVGIFLLLVDGAAAADPAVKPEQILTEAGLAAAKQAWDACMGTTPAAPTPSVADVLRPDADLGPLTAALQASAPDRVKLNAPVFLPQGAQDPLGALNVPLFQKLCADGASVRFTVYPGLGHSPEEVRAAGDDVLAWVQARLDGVPVEGACTLSAAS